MALVISGAAGSPRLPAGASRVVIYAAMVTRLRPDEPDQLGCAPAGRIPCRKILGPPWHRRHDTHPWVSCWVCMGMQFCI